jgi:hypothetical protein
VQLVFSRAADSCIQPHIPGGAGKTCNQIATFESRLHENGLDSIGVLIDENGTVGPLGSSCTGMHVLPDNRGPFKSSKELLLASIYIELSLVTRPHRMDGLAFEVQKVKWRLGSALC